MSFKKVLHGIKANDMKRRISENVVQIKKRMDKAAERAGRNVEEIVLMGASKNRSAEAVNEAYEAGVKVFGENRVQELISKRDGVTRNAKWHFIGHLQRNKVKDVVGAVDLIHSVDSLRLGIEVDKKAFERNIVQTVLLQVNVGKEESKYGLSVEELKPVLIELSKCKNIGIKGLSTIAPYAVNAEDTRWVFRELRMAMEEINNETGAGLVELSMGMTGDFEVAVEEGATIIRVGTGVFGEILGREL
ncbi:MAG: YggS family pyridoxal phosphate-dependent enzyme [Actinobacteria bacterium]|nr:YggS family pyridoxal phosphate-dependent enzyme [Actinomycetota bacterium]